LDLASWLWLTLIGLPFASIVEMHFQTIIRFSKPHLSFHSPHYSWFMQYMKNDKGDCKISQLPLGMVYFQSSHLKKRNSNFTFTLYLGKEFNY